MRPPDSRSDGPVTAVGIVAWVAALLVLPAPLAARIFLLAPLVVVPRLVTLLPPRPGVGRLGGWPLLVAALPLMVAFGLPAGPLPGALVLPWLACAIVGLAAVVRHGLPSLPSILRPSRLPDLGVDVALGFWAVGAVFALLDRLGVDTGFSPVIVLLTATHFHFAGFGLLAVASLLAVPRTWVAASVAGLMVGIPLTALGFVLRSDAISAAGALVTGLSGIGVAIGLVTSRVAVTSDWLVRLAGVALLVGMPMGIAWSMAILTGQTFLDLETMVRTHGALNATAVLLAVLAGRPGR
jgi:hypothetical protein